MHSTERLEQLSQGRVPLHWDRIESADARVGNVMI